MPNTKRKTKKGVPSADISVNINAVLIKTVNDMGIMRKAIAERTGIEYKRMDRIYYGARVFVDEAFAISKFLRIPVTDLFPHVVQSQSN